MGTSRPALPTADDLECDIGLGLSISGCGSGSSRGCSAFEVAPESCRTRGSIRCAHTRWRWISVAALLLAWGCVSWVLQWHDVQVFDLLARHFRVSAAGQAIAVRPGGDVSAVYGVAPDPSGQPPPRAAFVMLSRSRDVEGVVTSMTRLLARFNNSATQFIAHYWPARNVWDALPDLPHLHGREHHVDAAYAVKIRYPWVFLDNGVLDDNFRQLTTAAARGPTRYGTIPARHWSYPPWIPTWAAAKARQAMKRNRVLYGAQESYHHMCRFFSGFFMLHPLLAEVDYYWRVEPDVHFYCDMPYDPFQYMRQHQVKYGFTLAVVEGRKTIPTLWHTTRDFMARHADLVAAPNLLDFVVAPDGDYNLCHFWSNFEMGDLRWFRSKPYQAYFEHLDKAGGFFYERWGDAPVHSLAAAMLLNASEVHYFSDIGYRHNSMTNCPAVKRNNCDCDPMLSVGLRRPSNSFGRCHARWDRLMREKLAAHRA